MDSTERFSKRVDDYVKYRPNYPAGVFDAIERRVGARELSSGVTLPRTAADVGSGSGIFTRALLERGWTVHAVEPNQAMREAAEQSLGHMPRLLSRKGTAELTGLPDGSVALVVAAQAFHWFDAARCREEWRRILLPGGLVSLVWNVRQLGTPFMDAYEAVLTRLLPEYSRVTHRHVDEAALGVVFGQRYETERFSHQQVFDWDGLAGRVTSSSYAPKPEDAGYDRLMRELRQVFSAHACDGVVVFRYDAIAVFGDLS
jgi:SAM-dependent methyltransferase